jgi:hypothetical protein
MRGCFVVEGLFVSRVRWHQWHESPAWARGCLWRTSSTFPQHPASIPQFLCSVKLVVSPEEGLVARPNYRAS